LSFDYTRTFPALSYPQMFSWIWIWPRNFHCTCLVIHNHSHFTHSTNGIHIIQFAFFPSILNVWGLLSFGWVGDFFLNQTKKFKQHSQPSFICIIFIIPNLLEAINWTRGQQLKGWLIKDIWMKPPKSNHSEWNGSWVEWGRSEVYKYWSKTKWTHHKTHKFPSHNWPTGNYTMRRFYYSNSTLLCILYFFEIHMFGDEQSDFGANSLMPTCGFCTKCRPARRWHCGLIIFSTLRSPMHHNQTLISLIQNIPRWVPPGATRKMCFVRLRQDM
jgi:hypothetical protein